MRFVATLGMLSLLLATWSPTQPVVGQVKSPHGRFSYLENGQVKVGVDLAAGGAITEFSVAGSEENLLDSGEWGRQLHARYSSGPVPYAINGKRPPEKWLSAGWSAAQIGSSFRQPSAVLEHQNDGKTIRVKTRPMQWGLEHEPAECTIETRVSLEGAAMRVSHRLENHRSDKALYPAREQLMPAAYVAPRLRRLKTYVGANPHSKESATTLVRGPLKANDDPWINFTATESWAALVDDEDWGLGLCVPGRTRFRGGAGDTLGTMLAAPRMETLDREIVFEHEFAVIAGSLETIRTHAGKLSPKPGLPSWNFSADRQGWHALGANEKQFPFDGDWKLLPTGPKHQQLNSPDIFWSAEQAPVLRLEAAFKTQHPRIKVWWLPWDAADFTPENSMILEVNPDGEMRSYSLNLASVATYRGGMTRVRIDTTPLGRPGDEVRIRVIAFGPAAN